MAKLSVNYDFGRTISFYAFDKSYDYEGSVNYYFNDAIGMKLGLGYGYFHPDIPYKKMMDCNISSLLIKPGLIFRHPRNGIRLETTLGFSIVHQSGYYIIPNSYWEPYVIQDKNNFVFSYLGAYLTKTIFHSGSLSFNAGIGVEIFNVFQLPFWGTRHFPVYVPSFGEESLSHYSFLGTIEYRIK